ncbi:MAG: hypothetical protein ABJP45_15900, partial [Cyclobacteriaceae bacterium]
EAAERYQEGKAGLWQMPDLQLALNWREENRPTLVWGQRYNPAFERTMVFLETSEKAYLTEQRNKEILQKRQVRRMRVTAIVLSIAALVSLTFMVYGFIKSNDAEKQAILANEQAELAKAETARAEIQSQLAITRAAEAEEARAESDLQREKAESATLDAQKNAIAANNARAAAEVQRLAAVEAQAAAEVAKEQADEQRAAADEQRVLAEAATLRADQARYQAIAQSMAIKAKTIVPEDSMTAQLKGLVARQAYRFYEEYKEEGKDYNGDIYSGVYSALQGLYEIEAAANGADDAKYVGDSTLSYYHKAIPKDAANTEVGVRSVVYAKDGKSFYSAGSNGEVLKWDVETRVSTQFFKRPDVEVARLVNVSEDERYLALGTQDDHILIFNAQLPGSEPTILDGHAGGIIYDLVFLPDNSGFISVGSDNRILRSDFRTSEELTKVPARVKTLDISPDAKTLVGGSMDGNVYKWDLTNMSLEPSKIDRKSSARVTSVKFSNKGNSIAIGDEKGIVIFYNIFFSQQIGPNLTGFRAPVTDIEFSPDDRLILATSANKQARMWDTQNLFDLPTVLNDYPGEKESGWVYDASFSPDGNYFLTAAGDGNIRRYPTTVHAMAEEICEHISLGNMSDSEWQQYVGDPDELPFVATCEGLDQRPD